MPSTAIGLSFDLHDIGANYEVIGTSDNYSFQYQLGRGEDLITGEYEEFGQNEFTGERIQTIVPLKGNYGNFDVRVFAVSDIGTRSEFVQEQIYISPPAFDGTFTFANLKIDDLPDTVNLNNVIIGSPDNVGDTLEVESEYVNKNISLSWDLIPPEGHSLGGQAVNEELNSDAFFDHFEIKIKNTKDNILIDDATLNNSVSLQDSLSTANVAGKLSSYTNFNLQINETAFSEQELNLDRNVFFEISAFDSKGGSCTGTLSGINFFPDLSLSQRTNSSDSSFFFSSEDSDFEFVEVNYIGIPVKESLIDIYDLQNNIDFFRNIKDASEYVSLKDEQFYQDQSMVVFEGDVYIARQTHLNSNLTSPPNSVYWLNVGPKVDYVSESLRVTEESFVNRQIFGYSYYYTFRPSDGYGTGQLFNFTEDGLVEASNFAELSPITSEIKIENLNFREREDDLIFEWNFVDQDGLPVELANEKYQINFGDEPKVLGLSGHLFDNHTNRYLSGIGEEKLNSEFTYSRELNNSIYKDGGFPEGIENFDSSEIYTPDDNDKVIDKTDIFHYSQYFTDEAATFFSTLPVEKEFVYNSIKQNADKQPYIRPFYEYWDPAKTYYYRENLPFSDVVKYNGVLYESLSDSGPGISQEIGVFNENTVYNLNDLVVAPTRNIEIFDNTKSYLNTDVVLYEGAIYESLTSQSVGNAIRPDLDSSFWKIIRPFSDIDCSIYKYIASSSASTLPPTRDETQSWQLQTPDVSDKFKVCIDSYSNNPNADYVFFNETVYKANISTTTSEPPIPLTTLNQDYTTLDWTPFWEINDSLEDVVFGHVGIPESGKRSVGLEVGIVSSDGQVVSRERIIGDNPAPVISNNGFSVDSESEVTKVKFNFNYLLGRQEKTTLLNLYRSDQPDFEITGSDGLPFTEISVPEEIFNEPGSEDYYSYVTKNQDLLDFYNNPNNFWDYDRNGVGEPIQSRTLVEFGENHRDAAEQGLIPLSHQMYYPSTFVKSVVGEGDATFGDNITQIVDDTAEVGEEITGYYYKLLPFDDFGSGALYTAVDDRDPIQKVWVLPKNFHSKNPDAPTGPAIKITTDEIPGPVVNLTGSTAFENYFLNWNMPNAQIQDNLLVDAAPNDISYYEVWQSTGQSNNFLKFDNGSSSSPPKFLTEEQNATGYRRIDGIQYTFGDNIPTEYEDFANDIINATNVLDIDASSPSIQITHRGQVNDTSYFWVRPVDHAGNKGPFTGASDLANTDNVEGLKLILGQAKTTDIADFEQNISQSFPNTISLVPNNPFSYNSTDDVVDWDDHVVYHDGEGYLVKAGSLNIGAAPYNGTAYIYWSSTETTAPGGKEETQDLESNPQVLFSQDVLDRLELLGIKTGGEGELEKSDLGLRNVKHAGQYEVSHYHPAGLGDGANPDQQNQTPKLLKDDGDFIIARIAGGVVSPMWHSFANAVIGSAHIEDAAITNAKIHNLTADKIRSAVIQGQDIQIGDNPPGQIRSQGFEGLDDTGQGFVVSGDGSFVFAADDGRLFFDNSELVLEGKLRQIDGKEYTFIDLDATPDSFFYNELSDGTFTMDDDTDASASTIRAIFQNSFIKPNEVRFKVSNPNNEYEFIKYSDFDDDPTSSTYGKYDISGFKYDPDDGTFIDGEPKIAAAQFKVTGFNEMINTVSPQLTTVIVSASGLNTSTERSIPINFVADGAAAVYAELKATQQVYSYDYDGKFNDANSNLNLEATAHNTHGNIDFIFETGVNLDSSSLVKEHTVTKNDGTASFQLADFADHALQYYSNTPFVAKLTISDKDENNNSRELASDFVSIFGTLPGKDSYTVFLTNENHTYPANENGFVSSTDLNSGKTQVRFFRGTKEYRYDENESENESFSLDGDIISSQTNSVTGDDDVTAETSIEEVGGFKKLFVKIGEYPDNENQGTFTIKVKDNQYKEAGTKVAFEKIYTYSKSIEAAKGRTVELSADTQAVKYDTAGSNPTQDSESIEQVKITAVTTNFIAQAMGGKNVEYQFFIGEDSITERTSNNIVYIPIPSTHDGTAEISQTTTINGKIYSLPVTIECKAYDQTMVAGEFEEDTNPRATDQITIFGLKEGSNAITVIQSQQFVNVPVKNDSSGGVTTVDVSNTENILTVFDGTSPLNYKSGPVPTDIDDNDIGFYVAATSSSLTVNSEGVNNQPQFKTNILLPSHWTTSENSAKINYAITVIDNDKQKRELDAEQNLVKTFDGTVARKVDLTANDQTIEYNSAGDLDTNSGAEITLTATAHNTIGDVYYKYTATDSSGAVFVNNPLDISGFNKDETEVKYTVPQVIGGPVKIKVEISEKSDGSVVLATDEMTIYSLKNGSDVITAILSNEAHSLTKDFGGTITSTGSGTDIKVFQGTKELSVNISASNAGDLNNNEFLVGIQDINQVTEGSLQNGDINGYAYVTRNQDLLNHYNNNDEWAGNPVQNITLIEFGEAHAAAFPNSDQTKYYCARIDDHDFGSFTGQSVTITYTIIFKNDVGETGTIIKQQTFSISQEGEHARKVDLTGDQAVKYNTAGSSPDPDEITLTATPLNQRPDSTLKYRYTLVGDHGTLKQGTSDYNGGFIEEASINYNPPDNKFKVATVMVEMSEDEIDVAKDTLSIYGIQDGSDVITAILSNEAHSLTKNPQGITSAGSGTDIKVFQGAEELTFTAGTLSSIKHFKVQASTNNNGVTIGGIDKSTGANEKHCVVESHNFNSFGGQSATITYTITFKNSVGQEGTIIKQQTFSISEQGIEGARGNKGVGVVFRGLWAPDKIYTGATETSDRGDVVFYDDGTSKYWMAQETHESSASFTNDEAAGKWKPFGGEFESVATDLLLAKDAVITHTLTMGQGDTLDGTEFVGHGGLIKTVGKEFGNGVTGFFLGNIGNPPNPQFDVGGENSFIRFDGLENRIEIKGSLTINGVDDPTIGFDSIDGTNSKFIGGGYNNFITGSQVDRDGIASSIVGGGNNNISGRFSFIGGGFDNNLGDNFSAIVAGYNNEMPNLESGNAGANFIGAGVKNTIDGGTNQSIVNGFENEIFFGPEDITINGNNFQEIIYDPDNSILATGSFGKGKGITRLLDNGIAYDTNFPTNGSISSWSNLFWISYLVDGPEEDYYSYVTQNLDLLDYYNNSNNTWNYEAGNEIPVQSRTIAEFGESHATYNPNGAHTMYYFKVISSLQGLNSGFWIYTLNFGYIYVPEQSDKIFVSEDDRWDGWMWLNVQVHGTSNHLGWVFFPGPGNIHTQTIETSGGQIDADGVTITSNKAVVFNSLYYGNNWILVCTNASEENGVGRYYYLRLTDYNADRNASSYNWQLLYELS